MEIQSIRFNNYRLASVVVVFMAPPVSTWKLGNRTYLPFRKQCGHSSLDDPSSSPHESQTHGRSGWILSCRNPSATCPQFSSYNRDPLNTLGEDARWAAALWVQRRAKLSVAFLEQRSNICNAWAQVSLEGCTSFNNNNLDVTPTMSI